VSRKLFKVYHKHGLGSSYQMDSKTAPVRLFRDGKSARVGPGRVVRALRKKNLPCALGVSDYELADERVREDRDDQVGEVLSAAGLPDSRAPEFVISEAFVVAAWAGAVLFCVALRVEKVGTA